MDFLTEGGGRTVCRTALPGNGLSERGGEGEQCAEQPYLAVDFLTEGGRENCGQNNLTWQWTFWQREGGRTALPGSGLSDRGREGEQPYLAVDFLTEGGRENSLTWQWTFWQREGEQLTELLVVHRQRLSVSVVRGVLSLLLSTLGQNVLHKATPWTEQNKCFKTTQTKLQNWSKGSSAWQLSANVMCQRRGEGRENSNSNPNSKTLIFKDNSIRFIWTYLTASPPCHTTNTNKHRKEWERVNHPVEKYPAENCLSLTKPRKACACLDKLGGGGR